MLLDEERAEPAEAREVRPGRAADDGITRRVACHSGVLIPGVMHASYMPIDVAAGRTLPDLQP
jgi:hypothetical protein